MYITMGISPLTSSKSKEKKYKESNKGEGVLQGQTEITCGHSYGHSIVFVFLCVRCVLRSPLWDFFSPHVHLAVNV